MWNRIQINILKKYLKLFPVVAISGPRQVGKSTLVQLKEIGKQRKYYTLDDLSILEIAQKNPEYLVKQDNLVTIDEVQRCPELLLEINPYNFAPITDQIRTTIC